MRARRGRFPTLALAALLAYGARLPALAATTYDVQIRGSMFMPAELHIAPGDTVRWTAVDEGHTVTADDGQFDFFKTRTLAQGERVQWTAPTRDVTVGYYCRVHGARGGLGMAGAIVVGRGSPRPRAQASGPRRTVPSAAFPTIARGVAGARPGTVVTVLPGVYRESVVIRERDITLRGGGRTASAVVLDGGLTLDTGITVVTSGVTVSGVTLRRYRTAGIVFRGATKFSAVEVQTRDNDLYGVRVEGSTGGLIDRAYAAGALDAGISVADCADCGVVVRRSGADDNAAGVLITGSDGVVVRDSTFRRNATGVVVKTMPGGTVTSAVHIYGNTVVDNAVANVRVRPPSDALDLPAGVGIWLAGANSVLVERNRVAGDVYGVALTALGLPANGNRVIDNVVSRSSAADVAWDGIGAGSCFARNTTPDGWSASAEPRLAESTYSCSLPTTVGVPDPKVLADITTHAYRTYYCRLVQPATCAP
ncbi:MAG: right-handed parallel beta-helix repeat-containing protein [Mycobacteriales bacterium]|nr:right-handed parallel beta-helix repeat-containing protein [Frankia sp.]